MKKRIVIGGCRGYNNYQVFCGYMDNWLAQLGDGDEIIILSGHCSGTDAMAEKYATQNNLELEIYPAEWKRYGKAAGPMRNRLMVENSDYVIAFWDGKSRGTKSLIGYAEKFKKPVSICNIN